MCDIATYIDNVASVEALFFLQQTGRNTFEYLSYINLSANMLTKCSKFRMRCNFSKLF